MISDINPMLLLDGYKTDHRPQFPKGTEYVYSNFTPRMSRVKGVDSVIFFGLQYFIKEYLQQRWQRGFFERPRGLVIAEYKRRMDNYLGPNAVDVQHIADLYDLGYLPIQIKALPEGAQVPIGVPVLTIVNTDPKFFWLTNYLETILSNALWKPITSATTAFEYRKKFEEYARKTGYDRGFIQWQGHDFSFRGMSGIEDALTSAGGHLLSFTGTDTVPAIDFLERYYNANSDIELIGGSVPATEHAVMCMGTDIKELDTFRRLICDIYPKGIVSIVSDTWDFWRVMTEYMPALKNEIINRPGRVVIRPDSGDPVKIICGDNETPTAFLTEPQRKGAYQLLAETFGTSKNALGYESLHPNVGLIYGDSITLERQDQILSGLARKGYTASNLVLGIGSYTYEYVTRDTFGFAMKATWGQVNGVERDIFKNPKTDSGFKKSAKGLLLVTKTHEGPYMLTDGVDKAAEASGELRTVYRNGVLIKEWTLAQIRENVLNNL